MYFLMQRIRVLRKLNFSIKRLFRTKKRLHIEYEVF